MRFDSAEFLFFLVGVLVLYHGFRRSRWILITASYLFYASWNPPFLLLLMASTALDYRVGAALGRTTHSRRRKWLLAASLVGNLGVLAYFKYVGAVIDFFIDARLVQHQSVSWMFLTSEIPLGISFYTFQTLSYSIDVYRRRIEPCRDPWDFALFVAFFPQLIAGPILRAAELLPQIRAAAVATFAQTLEGIELCLVGLFKKVVIADNFGLLVDACFAQPERYSGAALLVGIFGFSVQIFCDFSGYSTMARGLAKLLGYELPENFGYPLLASNPIAYRRDWHITMGSWFRDYVYHPLGGDRGGTARMARNTLLTWTAFGLWHGANLTFLLWGAFNGALLTVYRIGRSRELWPRGRSASLFGLLCMPLFVALANVFFRANDVSSAVLILGRVARWSEGQAVHPTWSFALLALLALHLVSRRYYREDLLLRLGWGGRLSTITALVASCYLLAASGSPFYYFRF